MRDGDHHINPVSGLSKGTMARPSMDGAHPTSPRPLRLEAHLRVPFGRGQHQGRSRLPRRRGDHRVSRGGGRHAVSPWVYDGG